MVDFKKIMKGQERSMEDEYKDRLKRCRPIAQKIIEMMAEEKLPMGDIGSKDGSLKKEVEEKYYDFSAKVLTLMLDSGVKYSERSFLFQLVLQTYEQTREKVIKAVDMSFERAFTKKWKDELDITMGDIHEVLLQ